MHLESLPLSKNESMSAVHPPLLNLKIFETASLVVGVSTPCNKLSKLGFLYCHFRMQQSVSSKRLKE